MPCDFPTISTNVTTCVSQTSDTIRLHDPPESTEDYYTASILDQGENIRPPRQTFVILWFVNF